MSSTDQLTPFGRPMLKHFLFDPKYKNLNHGIISHLLVSNSSTEEDLNVESMYKV